MWGPKALKLSQSPTHCENLGKFSKVGKMIKIHIVFIKR